MEEGRKSAIKLPSWLLLQNWRKKLWFLWLCLFSPTPIFLFRILCCLLSIVGKSLECVEKLRKVNPCKSWQCVLWVLTNWRIKSPLRSFFRFLVFRPSFMVKTEEDPFLEKHTCYIGKGRRWWWCSFSSFSVGFHLRSGLTFLAWYIDDHTQKCLCRLHISNLWKLYPEISKIYKLPQWLSKW